MGEAVEPLVAQIHGGKHSEREIVSQKGSTVLGSADILGQGGSDSEVTLNVGGGKVTEVKKTDAMEQVLVNKPTDDNKADNKRSGVKNNKRGGGAIPGGGKKR